MEVCLVGVPLTCGGANVESGATVELWRRMGVDVTVLYWEKCGCGKTTAKPEETNVWVHRLRDLGVDFRPIVPGELHKLGAPKVLVGFCVSHLLHNWPEFARLGYRLIWSPCMNYTSRDENLAFRLSPPSGVHFQSKYQYLTTGQQYAAWNCRDLRLIRGAFQPLPFRPKHRLQSFVVGRMARAARTKWSPHLWRILTEVRSAGHEVHALCQGWNAELDFHCGKPPTWARCMPQDTMSVQDFLADCDAMICPNWGMPENYPRVGLEAMSAGVPLVVDDLGGWRELCGEHAIYCKSPKEFSVALTVLAENEPLRLRQAERARKWCEYITDEQAIGKFWLDWFKDLGA